MEKANIRLTGSETSMLAGATPSTSGEFIHLCWGRGLELPGIIIGATTGYYSSLVRIAVVRPIHTGVTSSLKYLGQFISIISILLGR